jgi:transcriptional regulator with XRE-family HTH domain
VSYSANQAVALNLRVARALRGWTQEQAAEQLERYLGERWSKATWSVAERSVAGRRVKQFSADEIVAFSRAFSLPVSFFFLPIPDLEEEFPGVVRPSPELPREQELDAEILFEQQFDSEAQEFTGRFLDLLGAMPEEVQTRFKGERLSIGQRVDLHEVAFKWREVHSQMRALELTLNSLVETEKAELDEFDADYAEEMRAAKKAGTRRRQRKEKS